VPWSLERFQKGGDLHFITFSCYQREPLLGGAVARDATVHALERVRQWYGFFVVGYVVMPEHVHLLISEPEQKNLAIALQMLKQIASHELRRLARGRPFWQARYYDFNVWSDKKRIEKLRYLHRNPVNRGLVAAAGDWEWSSFRHYLTGERGAVEIESFWTENRREREGIVLGVSANR
jgi:putative transposase